MTRKVHAILISVPQPSPLVSPVKDAAKAVDDFKKFLGKRFPGIVPVELSSPSVTPDRVKEALDDAAASMSENGILILLFIGHGKQAKTGHAFQSWRLDGDTELSDIDLAASLGRLPTPNIVIISNSCYGAGIARPGPLSLKRAFHAVLGRTCAALGFPMDDLPSELRFKAIANALPFRLRTAAMAGDRSGLVCISAASSDTEVAIKNMPKLITKTIQFADDGRTYGALADEFARTSSAGHAFQVDTIPSELMCQVLFMPISTILPIKNIAI